MLSKLVTLFESLGFSSFQSLILTKKGEIKMIKVESTEQIKEIYDNTNIDWDRYTIEVSTAVTAKEYSVVG